MASRWLARAALAVCLLAALSAVWNGRTLRAWLDPEPVRFSEETAQHQLLECPPPFRTGAYTMEVEQAVYFWEEETQRAYLSIDLRAYTPKFWLEGPALGRYLEAVDSNGVSYSCQGSGPNSGHLSNAMWIDVYAIEGDPAWLDIHHRTAGWTIRVQLPQREEGTP